MEPSNSWEISYIISIYKPHIDLGTTKEECFFKIKKERASELRKWANRNFSHEWFLRHV